MQTEAALQEQLEDIQAKNEVYAETLVEAEEKQSRTEEAAQAKAAELEAELEKRTVELQAERDTSRAPSPPLSPPAFALILRYWCG